MALCYITVASGHLQWYAGIHSVVHELSVQSGLAVPAMLSIWHLYLLLILYPLLYYPVLYYTPILYFIDTGLHGDIILRVLVTWMESSR